MAIPQVLPWLLLSLVWSFNRQLRDAQEAGAVGLSTLFVDQQKDSCKLCDRVVDLVLKQAGHSGMYNNVDCLQTCFRIPLCHATCEHIKGAMANASTIFPCVAAGLCGSRHGKVSELDEAGCKWSAKQASCEPEYSCERRFFRCELRSGFRRWNAMSHLLGGFHFQPGWVALLNFKWLGLALSVVGGAVAVIQALTDYKRTEASCFKTAEAAMMEARKAVEATQCTNAAKESARRRALQSDVIAKMTKTLSPMQPQNAQSLLHPSLRPSLSPAHMRLRRVSGDHRRQVQWPLERIGE
uniref:Uncharacterized protein n=1 Tax=Haptolina brevifila TaxID=156173 RepID=A0A7S2MH72_9EUKA|mmetsp:Transcript_52216/g.103828  ORF Transcript_52216/g.103828 Transcript_52216/m.103828 type:complete len:297 (+) Transcript_52216:41-931(+)